MASPIQNLIGMGAAGAAPMVQAGAASKSVGALAKTNNPAIQQIIATQAAQVITKPGNQRITDNKEIIDPSFDSEEKEAKGKEESEEEQPTVKRKHDGSLDVVA